MQAQALGRGLVEVKRGHRLAYIGPQLVPRVGLGDDAFTQCLGDVTAVGLLGDFKNEFVHGAHAMATAAASASPPSTGKTRRLALVFWGLIVGDKVVPIARDHSMREGMGQHVGIGRRGRQDLAQAHDGVPELAQHVREVVGHVVIEQERHGTFGASCRATRRSISPR